MNHILEIFKTGLHRLASLLRRFVQAAQALFSSQSQAFPVSHFSTPGRKKDADGIPKQEDAFYCSPPTRQGMLMLVADGLGGQAYGEFASILVVQLFQEQFEQGAATFENAPAFFRQLTLDAIEKIARKGEEDPAYASSATTLTGFWVRRHQFFTVNVGDSRCYRMDANGKLSRLTKDHSLVQQLLDNALITEAEAFHHAQKNVMTAALGSSPDQMKIDVQGPLEWSPGELLLACSDGVHDFLTDEEMAAVLLENRTGNSLAEALVAAAFQAGSNDNITVCILKYDGVN